MKNRRRIESKANKFSNLVYSSKFGKITSRYLELRLLSMTAKSINQINF